MDKNKSKYVGVRITDEQASILNRLQEDSKLSKTELLLKGLTFLDEFYSLGLDNRPLKDELNALEEEALRYAAELKKVRKREEAIRDLIQQLHSVDRIVDKYHCEKSALIQILLEIQAENNWLPRHALMWVSERLGVPMSQIRHISTFYKAFYLQPRGKHLVRVCLGTACHVRGGTEVLDRAEKALGIKVGETTEDMNFTLECVNCLGCCALGPVMAIDSEYHSNPSSKKLKDLFAASK